MRTNRPALVLRASDQSNAAIDLNVDTVHGLIVEQKEHRLDDVIHCGELARGSTRRHRFDKGIFAFFHNALPLWGVPTRPGDTEFTLIGASSTTMVFIMPIMPALATLTIVEVG